ncbi:MAG: hypothetical protein K6T81_05570 [Alicyclobacillus macrosporangiidus]|uniref:hypothetical protein n=1 Tax=Alicyclobacillus macrosporangiidus TaxID=392015 RepID=UPI0026EF54AC|nr:hypothetical protein [Alicyclobacillus macrosporangiidus]MCL6598193.1 hypothetical protein [Alicyclobacillus macrosporangiidus]
MDEHPRFLGPVLPFTYAISVMREAVGGPLWSVVAHDLQVTVVYVLATLLLGLLVKPRAHRWSARFLRSARASGLIH